jgi:hypothetical protein
VPHLGHEVCEFLTHLASPRCPRLVCGAGVFSQAIDKQSDLAKSKEGKQMRKLALRLAKSDPIIMFSPDNWRDGNLTQTDVSFAWVAAYKSFGAPWKNRRSFLEKMESQSKISAYASKVTQNQDKSTWITDNADNNNPEMNKNNNNPETTNKNTNMNTNADNDPDPRKKGSSTDTATATSASLEKKAPLIIDINTADSPFPRCASPKPSKQPPRNLLPFSIGATFLNLFARPLIIDSP